MQMIATMARIAYNAMSSGCGIVIPDDRTNQQTIAMTATMTIIVMAKLTRSMVDSGRS